MNTVILKTNTAYGRSGVLSIVETPHDQKCGKCGAKDVDLLSADTSVEEDGSEYGSLYICFDCLSKAITLHTLYKMSRK